MTTWPRRRQDAQEAESQWAADEGNGEVGGWSWSTGASANASAVLRRAAWVLLALGPLLGGTALYLAPATAGPAQPQPAVSAPAVGAQGAAGFAQLFVAAYISAGDGDQAKLAAYYPGAADIRLEGAPGRRSGEQLAVVRLRQTDRDVWSVTVAARVVAASGSGTAAVASSPGGEGGPGGRAAAAVRYFQVPVGTGAAGGGVTGYVALSMPAEVSAPPRIAAPGLVYGPRRPALPGDPLTQAVSAFLGAYLTGAGELDRYLAPGTQVSAISPAPYSAVVVDQLAVEGERGGDPAMAVPGDGTRVRLLVVLRAVGRDLVRAPLAYALTVRARAGRWEIAAVDGAPAEAPAAGAPADGP
ncbi:conjugal transfer protein [Kitasatospora sp. NPDC049258]|uniref:conjugal transfer protein n=1 Tax=Kitasatospora sp. NPDC049258 TaxID=3155394 RepID=UPI0034252EAE